MISKMPSRIEIENDLKKFCSKLNALILVTAEGEAPQVLKSILAKHLFDIQNIEMQKQNPEHYALAQDIIKTFLSSAKIVMAKIEKGVEKE
jgi:hypothetical protein